MQNIYAHAQDLKIQITPTTRAEADRFRSCAKDGIKP